ncbi:MAG: hypothetical protein AB1478_11790 [Nitrospirota bacterium]
MLRYLEAIEELPRELKGPLVRVLELFREDIAETVKRSDFERFEKTTEENFNRVWKSVEELAEAQKSTEQRLEQFERATEENFNRVWKSIEELAEAQKRTEHRVEELAEAQKKTEEELASLTRTVRNMQKEIGGLSNTIGYELEDSLYPLLPKVLKEDFGVEIEGDLERTFIEYDGGEDEVNIYGKGKLNGRRVHIIGESKAQIGKGDVEGFVKMVKRLGRHLKENILPILVCYTVHPRVETYIKEHHPDIKLYKTFQVKRRVKV